MHWRDARTAVATLALGLLGGLELLRSAPSGPAPTVDGPVQDCPEPVIIRGPGPEQRLVCRGIALAGLLAVCPPDGPVHRGDRLQPTIRGVRCRTAVRPLTAGHRLKLGLRLDINRASAAELTRVRGIGPATARRIVAGRPWRSLQALDRVRGLGPRRIARIAPQLRATSRPPLRPWPWPRPPVASSPRRP